MGESRGGEGQTSASDTKLWVRERVKEGRTEFKRKGGEKMGHTESRMVEIDIEESIFCNLKIFHLKALLLSSNGTLVESILTK